MLKIVLDFLDKKISIVCLFDRMIKILTVNKVSYFYFYKSSNTAFCLNFVYYKIKSDTAKKLKPTIIKW